MAPDCTVAEPRPGCPLPLAGAAGAAVLGVLLAADALEAAAGAACCVAAGGLAGCCWGG